MALRLYIEKEHLTEEFFNECEKSSFLKSWGWSPNKSRMLHETNCAKDNLNLRVVAQESNISTFTELRKEIYQILGKIGHEEYLIMLTTDNDLKEVPNTDQRPSDKSLMLAAQCWCDEETENRTMDVELATAFAKRLDTAFATVTTPDAIKHLVNALNTDEGYRIGWKANIAMAFYDECRRELINNSNYLSNEILHKISNKAAENFLNNLCREQK